jgi:hypothetical protein
MILLIQGYKDEAEFNNALLEEMLFLSVMGLIILLCYLSLRCRLVFRKGRLPKFLIYRPKNIFRVYTSLCCSMVLYNKQEARSKVVVIEKYLKSVFPDLKVNIHETILTFLSKPVPHKPITTWLLKHKHSPSQNWELIQFLTKLGFRDGSLNHNEYAFLKILCKGLNIDLSDLNKFIEQNTPKSKKGVKKPPLKPRLSHYKTLAVPENAPWEDIKKSYRKLVKQYHPDRVINGTKSEIENAAKKFREIQEAYDSLEKLN